MDIEALYKIYSRHPKVCTDSRQVEKGSLFFALKGDKFDGNVYAAAALQNGASVAVVDDASVATDERYFVVDNTLTALQRLANYHRRQLHLPVIAITGTNGKTTTKELIRQVLTQRFNVLATKGNLNNHIGVPLTLLSITREIEIAIIEMGANHPGEIRTLCEIAEPNYGLITNIGKAHLEGFGSFEGVIQTKSELYQYLASRSGIVFFNSDNPILRELNKGEKKVCYGTTADCECVGKYLCASPFLQLKWTLEVPDKSPGAAWVDENRRIRTKLAGAYNFENVLAAICVGAYFDVDERSIKEALESYVPSNMRSQWVRTNRYNILVDTYNANPSSMRAALENFAEIEDQPKYLILGDMLELGEYSLAEHTDILTLVSQKGFEQVMLVGPEFTAAANQRENMEFQLYPDIETLAQHIATTPLLPATILIKGSHGMRLEKILDWLQDCK